MPPPTVFLVRHGRTSLNADGRLRGRRDVELDAVGQLEAARLAQRFTDVPLARIVSSPLRRAIQTATPIGLVHDLVVDIDDDLIDRDYGDWTGHRHTDVVERFGALDAAPGIEPRDLLENRLLRAFDRHNDIGEGRPVLFVGHDVTNATLLSLLVSELADGVPIEQHTGCWNRLEHVGGRWRAVVLNEIPTDASQPIGL